jgi:hypothetical protein
VDGTTIKMDERSAQHMTTVKKKREKKKRGVQLGQPTKVADVRHGNAATGYMLFLQLLGPPRHVPKATVKA